MEAHLYKLREGVCHSGSKGVEEYQHPEVEDCRVLSQESVPPHLVPSQGLHDLQVMQLIPLLCKMDLHQQFDLIGLGEMSTMMRVGLTSQLQKPVGHPWQEVTIQVIPPARKTDLH